MYHNDSLYVKIFFDSVLGIMILVYLALGVGSVIMWIKEKIGK